MQKLSFLEVWGPPPLMESHTPLDLIMSVSALYFTLLLLIRCASVALYTLWERKILAMVHTREGVVHTGWRGELQPFSDALKLLRKAPRALTISNKYIGATTPGLILITSMLVLLTLPWVHTSLSAEYKILLLLILILLSAYIHLAVGWAANSSYSLMGASRSLAMSISYEVSLAFMFILLLYGLSTINLTTSHTTNYWMPRSLIIWPVFVMWVISIIAETNRTPFDFSEGERELVSGYNVEYGALRFTLLFLAEYLSIITICLLTSLIFSQRLYWVSVYLLIYLFLWVRATLPRTRYDKLISLCWTLILPIVLLILLMAVVW